MLTDLYLKEKGQGWDFDALPTLPIQVCEWAGLDDKNPLVADGRLSDLNDSGFSFAAIADRIEREL